ncbi:MAG: Ig-like domain-containing protein [Longimicrobiales bacterium]
MVTRLGVQERGCAHRRIMLAGAIVFAFLSACDDGPQGPDKVPAAITAAAGLAQTAVVGSQLAQALQAVVTDDQGQPVANARVDWQPAQGSGNVTPASATTDAQGRAATNWTLGTVAGTQRVAASVGSISAEFTATATPGPAVAFQGVPDSLTLEPGMDSTLHVGARDAHGNSTTVAPQWTSGDPNVARIGPTGSVIAVAPGRTSLTAVFGGATARVTLVVGFRYVQVAAGYDHVCALTAGGRAHCWGLTLDSQAGLFRPGETCNVSTPCLKTPQILTNSVAFSAISPGLRHTCGISVSRQLHCWGSNFSQALGTANPDWAFRTERPTLVDGGRAYTAVAADDEFGCALDTAGSAYCWGKPGSLGNTPGGTIDRPVAVAGGLTFNSLSASGGSVCALVAAGEAYCWGHLNADGRLGLGDRAPHYTPLRVMTNLRFRSLSTGAFHTCGIAMDGRAYCWGSNSHGQLGVLGIADATTPVAVTTNESFAVLAAGGTHTCGIITDGRAFCWGSNYDGQLGNGNVISGPEPRPVVGGLVFSSLHTKRDFICGIATDNRLYCWGDNDHGQIGDGAILDRVVPVRVNGQM